MRDRLLRNPRPCIFGIDCEGLRLLGINLKENVYSGLFNCKPLKRLIGMILDWKPDSGSAFHLNPLRFSAYVPY